MLIVHRRDGRDREVEVSLERSSARVAELAAALGEPGPGLLVDGVAVPLTLPLRTSPLVRGSIVEPLAPGGVDGPGSGPGTGRTEGTAGSAGARGRETGALELAIVAGPGAGAAWPVGAGRHVLGRSPEVADVVVASDTVSARHAELHVGRPDGAGPEAGAPGALALVVRDLGSRNGTWLGGRSVGTDWEPLAPGALVRLGAVVLRVGRPPLDRPAAADPVRHADGQGRVVVNRPPRPPRPAEPASVVRPDVVDRVANRPVLMLLPALLPALAGLVTVAVTGNWLFALLPLFGPLVALAAWAQARHRADRAGRRDGAKRVRALAGFRRALHAAGEVELARRRSMLPDLAEVIRRIELPSRRLWERRPPRRVAEAPDRHEDWLRLNAGIGVVAWSPPVGGGVRVGGKGDEAVEGLVAAVSRLLDAPVEVDLSGGGVVGIVGDGPVLREAARRLARALVVQAAALHGPADLALTVVAGGEHEAGWRWTRWLPHHDEPDHDAGESGHSGSGDGDSTSGHGGDAGRSGRADRDDIVLRALLRAGEAPGRDPRTRLVVLDDERRLAGARSPARAVLAGRAGPVAGIVVAGGIDRLPSSCSVVVELRDATGLAVLQRLRPDPAGDIPPGPANTPNPPNRPVRSDRPEVAAGAGDQPVLVAGLSVARATGLARRLARYVDGDQVDRDGRLPASISLDHLLAGVADALDGAATGDPAGRWAVTDGAVALPVPLGQTEEGPLVVDLVADGPHALVAGTTGAGKSELLRTWVAGLAATIDPRDLNVVLIDYKGGAAFDACSRLPHTVSVVTDLDEALAARALRCLEAELRRRETHLRGAGVDDLRHLAAAAPGRDRAERLPRLVVVVDEFAALAGELPGFVDSLVDVAQRGRSLGVHLILATQRPAGVVNDRLRANVALRIALRVQDRQESRDVIGLDDAADLPRRHPGRAVVRFGPGEVVTMQTARADHLAALAERTRAAATRLGIGPPRSPWPPPLPARLLLDELHCPEPACSDDHPGAARPIGGPPTGGSSLPEPAVGAPFCLLDDPDRQTRRPAGWDPERGNLLVVGNRGSGTTTALTSLAIALARTHRPDRLHLYGVGAASGDLDPLARLPHCGGVVHLGEPERLARLVLRLRAMLDDRRHRAIEVRRDLPRVVVLVDDWTALQAALDEPGLAVLADALERVLLEGATVGLHVALSVERPGGLRPALAGSIGQRLVLHLNDPVDSRSLGLRMAATGLPGRGVGLPGGLELQVALPGPAGCAAAVDDVAALFGGPGGGTAGDRPPGGRGPSPLGTLPDRIELADLGVRAGDDEPGTVRLAVGVGWTELAPVGWQLRLGEHLLVAGPARSGRTTALCTVAALVRRLRPDWRVAALGARGPLPSDAVTAHGQPGALSDLVAMLCSDDGSPTVLLVDDADLLDDAGNVLAGLLAVPRPDLSVVAAGRNDGLRSQYGTWLRRVRMSRAGLLLQPDADVDGDLLGVRLPRRPLVAMRPGRGYLVDGGSAELVQVASPS